MQFIPAVLAASAALFACASANVEHHGNRHSNKHPKHEEHRHSPSPRRSRSSCSNSVIGGDSAVWGPSLSSSSSCGRRSRSSYGCRNPCYTPCNPCFTPAAAANPFVAPNCLPCPSPCAAPCASPCGVFGNDPAGVQPWYIYLTATSTVVTTATISEVSEATSTLSTVDYVVFQVPSAPPTYWFPQEENNG